MAAFTLNGATIRRGSISMPLSGAWTATVLLSGPLPSVGDSVTIEGPGLSLKGSAFRAGTFAASGSIRVVAGKGTLSRILAARCYRAPLTVGLVLDDLMTDAGEVLAGGSDAAVLGTPIDAWTRERGTAARALATLLDRVGSTYRYQDDGTILVGKPTYPVVDFPHIVQMNDRALGRITFASEDARLRPGVTFDGVRVGYVDHVIATGSVRTEAWYAPASGPLLP